MLPLKVAGLGVYFPEQRETKEDFIRRGIPEDVIEKLGVYERRVVAKGQTAADLELEAARIALKNADMAAADIDLIISTTLLPEMIGISNANLLQHRLGAQKAAAFDVSLGCGAAIPAILIAANFLALGQYQRILLTSSTHWSVISDPDHFSADFPLGDGAAAVLLKASRPDYGIMSFEIQTNGRFYYNCGIDMGHDHTAKYYDRHNEKLFFFMDKSAVEGAESEFKEFALTSLPATFRAALGKANLEPRDVDCAVIHANVKPLTDAWISRMGIPAERFPTSYERYGNVSAATIFINLYEGLRKGMIKGGDVLTLSSQGAGFTAGTIIMRWEGEALL